MIEVPRRIAALSAINQRAVGQTKQREGQPIVPSHGAGLVRRMRRPAYTPMRVPGDKSRAAKTG